MTHLDRLAIVAVTTLLVAGLGCERSPEDVENWRGTKNGMKKMQEWATSPDEPTPVRVRAVQVMIEEHQPTTLDATFEEISDDDARQKLVSGGVVTIEEMWNIQDMPTMDETDDSGKVKIEESEAVKAVDAAYYLIPYAEGDNQSTLQGILDTWLSKDWKLREKLGKVSLGQVFERAGDRSVEHLLTWLEESDDPQRVAKLMRENAGDREVEDRIAEVLVERANQNHPEISPSLLSAIVNTDSEKVVPYLKKAIRDSESRPKLVDQSMEALKTIQGERAAPFFTTIIEEHKGKLRWAAVNDLISLRGKGGILSAATALPLEKDTYAHPENDSFRKDAEWFANFVGTEMKDADVSTLSNTLVRALESDRWPVQVLGLMTARSAHQKDLLGDGFDKVVDAVDKLTSDRTEVPGWGEDKRIGEIAHETLDALEKQHQQ